MMKQLTESEYKKTKWWRDTQAWIGRIPDELDSKKGAKPKKAWRVFEAETWAAARAAAWAAARAAAWDAAWVDAWTIARTTAREAARAAAGDAARTIARTTAREAARDAEGDAALLARIKVCAGLKLEPKHVKHAEERWEANKRGFRVLCDVDGVLYVYRQKTEK